MDTAPGDAVVRVVSQWISLVELVQRDNVAAPQILGLAASFAGVWIDVGAAAAVALEYRLAHPFLLAAVAVGGTMRVVRPAASAAAITGGSRGEGKGAAQAGL
jgi:hypothetical protein